MGAAPHRSVAQGDAPVSDPAPEPSAAEPRKGGERVVIKKYANRRLYNTQSSTYVTLEHLSEMVKEGVDFVVYDAKTNEDITRQVLTQIIFEAENSGQNLLPIQFLRQLIQLYGAQVQTLVPSYLEMSLDAFARQQDRLRDQLGSGFTNSFPGGSLFGEQVRQNMALFDRAMKMFTPFAYGRSDTPTPAPAAQSEESIHDLKQRMDAMQRQLESLAKKG
jgi:polyhydroxyalkanoate synthesis repressor PhaR